MTTSHALRILTRASIVLGCVLLSGCDSKKSQKVSLTKSRKDAETVVAGYFQALATNGYAEAAANIGPEAFQKMSREQWIQAQQTFAAKRGDYMRHTFKRRTVRMKKDASGITMTVAVECQVTYSKHSDTETFSLLKGPTDGDFKIVGHKLNSPP